MVASVQLSGCAVQAESVCPWVWLVEKRIREYCYLQHKPAPASGGYGMALMQVKVASVVMCLLGLVCDKMARVHGDDAAYRGSCTHARMRPQRLAPLVYA